MFICRPSVLAHRHVGSAGQEGVCLGHSCPHTLRCLATVGTQFSKEDQDPHLPAQEKYCRWVRGREVSRSPLVPAPGSPGAPAPESSHSLEKYKAPLRPCWAHAPRRWGSGPEATLPPAAPKPPAASRSGQGRGVGVMASRLRPLSQAPAEFNSKVQRAFASFPDERPLSRRDELVNKRWEGGPGQAGPPPLPAHSSCQRRLSTLCRRSSPLPHKKSPLI